MVLIVAIDEEGQCFGSPTTKERAEEITKLLKGRLGLKYKIVSV